MTTTPNLSFGAIGFPTTLHFAGWTTNPPATVIVANPSQQSTSVTATTSGTVTANWEQAN
jgi:hypothetical protein